MLRRPGWLLVWLCALLVLCLARIGTLAFDSDINGAFYTDSPLSQAQRAFEAGYDTVPSDVVLLVEGEGALDAADLVAIRDVALDLELMSAVLSVLSPFVLRFPPEHPDLADEPVIPPEIDMPVVRVRLDAFARLGTGLPTMIASDAALVIVSVDTAQRPLTEALAEIRQLAEPMERDGLTLTITGPEVIGIEISEGLQSDLLVLNLVGAGIVALAALLFLRDLRLALVATLPGVLGMAGALGLAAWLAIPITVLNNVIPMLVLIVGVANGLHLAMHLARATGGITDRVADTLRSVGPASLLTLGTTALAFASIMVTSNRQLSDFGLLGLLAMAIGAVFLLAGFATLALLLAPAPRDIGGRLGNVSGGLGLWAARRANPVIAVGVVLLVLSGAAFATTRAWFPLSSYLPVHSPLRAADDRIEAHFNGIFRAWVEVPAAAGWEGYTAVVQAVEAVSPPGAVLSKVTLARWLGTQEPADTALDRLPAAIAERLTDSAFGLRRFSVAVPEPMRSDATLAQFDSIETAALQAGALRVIGTPAILRHGSVELIHELSIGLVLASAGGALVVALAFRSLRLLPVVLFVNLLPVLVVGAAPHLLNDGRLTPPLALALTIAFGIAVDDTIHLLSRFDQALRGGLSRDDALRLALTRAGGVMTMTTLLLGAGLAVTAFSIFEPVRLFGATLILSLGAALLTDLVLLPALLSRGVRHVS